MADAEDLKSSGDFSSCGFDSHPGHQFFLLKMNELLRRSFPCTSVVPELGMSIDLGPTRSVSFLIARYPELAEFQTMLAGWPMKRSWNGRHFVATPSKEKDATTVTLWLRRNDVGIEFTEREWVALRELSQKASASPGVQRWLEELRLEYGEQG